MFCDSLISFYDKRVRLWKKFHRPKDEKKKMEWPGGHLTHPEPSNNDGVICFTYSLAYNEIVLLFSGIFVFSLRLSVFDHVLLWCYIFQCISWIMYTSIYFILFHANFKWQNTFCFLSLFPYAHTQKKHKKGRERMISALQFGVHVLFLLPSSIMVWSIVQSILHLSFFSSFHSFWPTIR